LEVFKICAPGTHVTGSKVIGRILLWVLNLILLWVLNLIVSFFNSFHQILKGQ
jgi:hypothetical protein